MLERPSERSVKQNYAFPDPRQADDQGVVAVGGPFDGKRLLEAYGRGIFPWNGDPVRWYCPDPRSIFWQVRLPRRLGRMVRRGGFRVTFDEAFSEVVAACAGHHRDAGEWITPAFERAYAELHAMGHAHSVEVWQGDQLAGGLYGVQVAGAFSGESMFYRVADASKVAFAALAHHLYASGVVLFDSQVINEHTHALGAVLVHRDDFLQLLQFAREAPARYDGQRWPRSGAPFVAHTALAEAVKVDGSAPAAQAREDLVAEVPTRFWSLAGG